MQFLIFADAFIPRIPLQILPSLFIAVIISEIISLWIFCNLILKQKVNFCRILRIVLIANITSSVLGLFIAPLTGTPLGFNLIDLPRNLFYLCFEFIASLIIELPFYNQIYHKIHKITTIIASAIANLSSYLIIAIFVVYMSVYFPSPSPETIQYLRYGIHGSFGAINRAQQAFYLEHQRFASDLEELGLGEIDQFYRFNILVDEEKAQARTIPKIEEFKKAGITGITNVTSATGIIFVLNKEKPEFIKFISGVCVTERPSNIPPATPQLVDGEIQCPPGSDLRR